MGTLKVLIVDDDVRLRDSLVRLVAVQGHTTDVAGNAHEAMDKLHESHFDAVITDVQMPGQQATGINLLHMMHRAGITPPTYVHSGESSLYFNGSHILLTAFIAENFSAFASFRRKGDAGMLRHINAFLESIKPSS